MKTIISIAVLILSASILLAAPYLTVVFEYTVGQEGSRRDLHVFRIEDPRTRQDLGNALTQKEKQLGVSIISKRKPPSLKEAGKKLYEIELFDLATRQYMAH